MDNIHPLLPRCLFAPGNDFDDCEKTVFHALLSSYFSAVFPLCTSLDFNHFELLCMSDNTREASKTLPPTKKEKKEEKTV